MYFLRESEREEEEEEKAAMNRTTITMEKTKNK
jgi:hypothetical protein